MMAIILAVLIGGAFGFILDRVGATNPGYIIKMLNFSDLHLMKTIFLAIGVAAILMFGGILTGLVDPGHMSVKTTYIGVFLGGLMLGIGFAVSGFCPGTGLASAATGRIDAMFFVIGGLIGAAAYMGSYEMVVATGILEPILGGKTTLGTITETNYSALLDSVSGEWVGVIVGVIFVGLSLVLPSRLVPETH